jgi:hypothetical protein
VPLTLSKNTETKGQERANTIKNVSKTLKTRRNPPFFAIFWRQIGRILQFFGKNPPFFSIFDI